jgi:formylglycine-generating enzyme required for sulfatase activity
MELPARIGKYELQEFLGGGMSHVYRALDTVIGRTVAVKILTAAGCEDAEAKARFLAEARMAGNITHDNILSIFDFGEDDQHRPFMVMEFLRGEDLRHAIRNGNTGDLSNKLKIALQVARALEYVHTQRIIHRDIKPENIHINPGGVVKLMDFGIAKTEGLAMTRAGYVLGTPYYMAPEQVTGQNITEQVDVYAFGVLLFELLSGVKPISGDTVERIFYSILNEPLNIEPLHQGGFPQAVCDLVARCTVKNPTERPQGFGPVCAELQRILTELEAPTVAVEAPAPPRSTRPAWLLPAALLVVAGLAAGLYLATRSKPAVVAEATKGSEFARTISMASGDMVLVPAGPFLTGDKKRTAAPLPAFYIDKTEVSNQAYAAFCNATGHPLPEDFPADKPDYPVVNITILDAQAFAQRAGKRLPNAREWEKAARGTDGRLYPWGNDVDPSRANVKTKQMHPVTDFAGGASPFGALNMMGNVWELVEQLSTPSPRLVAWFREALNPPPKADEPWYTIRGLSYKEPWNEGALWDQGSIPSRFKAPDVGFRCAKDAQ